MSQFLGLMLEFNRGFVNIATHPVLPWNGRLSMVKPAPERVQCRAMKMTQIGSSLSSKLISRVYGSVKGVSGAPALRVPGSCESNTPGCSAVAAIRPSQ